METEEPGSPQEPPSPPPPPSPPSPSTPENPGLPTPEQPSEAHARQLLMEEWRPPGGSLELPPGLTWKLLFLRRPLYRNLLRSPNPEGAHSGADSGAERPPGRHHRLCPPSRSLTQTVRFLVFLSLFLSLSLCFSLSLFLSSVPLSVSLRLSFGPRLHLYLYLSLCRVPLSLPVSLSHPGSLFPSFPPSLSLCLYSKSLSLGSSLSLFSVSPESPPCPHSGIVPFPQDFLCPWALTHSSLLGWSGLAGGAQIPAPPEEP